MSDIPKYPVVQLDDSMRRLLKASQAVKEGIATHAEKHIAARHEAHAKLETERRLAEAGNAE